MNAGLREQPGVCSWLLLALLALPAAATELQPCRINVVDKSNGWPVPLIELRTTSKVRFVTDNAGAIAFDLPEAMGRDTWLEVVGHGYETPRDGFGYHGVHVTPTPGGEIKLEVNRTMPAKCVGRLTGAGLFGESQKLGTRRETEEAGIVGCDSVQTAEHGGKLFWAWGDTMVPGYPLGIYDTTSATTALQPLRSFQPPLEFTYAYFRRPEGKVRGVAKMPGSGPTWISGYANVKDSAGAEHLVCTYQKISGHLDVYETGLAIWNDGKAEFERLRALPKDTPAPLGHVTQWKDHLYFGDPFPGLRMPASFEAWQDASQWERLEPQKTVLAAGDGRALTPHRGSIAWNAWRKRWVTVFEERFGKPSAFGELWYAEADAPTGPWGRGVKVLTHDNYTFYNPQLHPEFTPADSPILLFEGTYTAEFADHAAPTPRYDYNQILYRLDLDDPALAPAQHE